MRVLLVNPPMDGAEPPTPRRRASAGIYRLRPEHATGTRSRCSMLSPAHEAEGDHRRDRFARLRLSWDHGVRRPQAVISPLFARRPRAEARCLESSAGGYLPTSPPRESWPLPRDRFHGQRRGETSVSEVFGRISRNETGHDVAGDRLPPGRYGRCSTLRLWVPDLDSLPFRRAMNSGTGRADSEQPGMLLPMCLCSIHGFYRLHGRIGPTLPKPGEPPR